MYPPLHGLCNPRDPKVEFLVEVVFPENENTPLLPVGAMFFVGALKTLPKCRFGTVAFGKTLGVSVITPLLFFPKGPRSAPTFSDLYSAAL